VARFLIRRTLQGLFVLWLMTVTVFLIFFVGPAGFYPWLACVAACREPKVSR